MFSTANMKNNLWSLPIFMSSAPVNCSQTQVTGKTDGRGVKKKHPKEQKDPFKKRKVEQSARHKTDTPG